MILNTEIYSVSTSLGTALQSITKVYFYDADNVFFFFFFDTIIDSVLIELHVSALRFLLAIMFVPYIQRSF